MEVWTAQIRSKFDIKPILDSGSIFGTIFDRFWVDLGVILGSKIDQKSMLKFDRFLDAFWEGFGAA